MRRNSAQQSIPRSFLRIGTLLVLLVASIGCASDEGAGLVEPEPPTNRLPVFQSTPVLVTDHNRPYRYEVRVGDSDGDSVMITAPQLPNWLSLDPQTRVLTGLAGWNNIRTFGVTLRATDGDRSAEQRFSVAVQRGEILCDQDFGAPDASPYILPYPVGKTYRVIQSYCPSNPAWGHRNWFAYDFDTATGDTVLASRGGTAIFVREDRPNVPDCSGGKENFVFILHDDGTVMHYMHLNTNGALVERNERVRQGQPIGLSGNSGCSAGPHLHVALFRNRTNFDRQSTLPFNYSNAAGPLDANRGLTHQGSYEALPE